MTGGSRSPQLVRIARLLAVAPGDVRGLDDVPDADLRALHDQISESYFAAGREGFAKVAALSRVLPSAVAGRLAERFLPPVFGARTAELLDPAKAADLVSTISVRYLADLSVALDPTRSRPVVRALPARRVAEVAAELFRRGEYLAMAEFAGTVTADALLAAIEVADGRDLVEVVALIAWNDEIDRVFGRLPVDKIDAILAEIIDSDRWDDADAVLGRLPAAARNRARVHGERLHRLRAAVQAGVVGPAGIEILRRCESGARDG
jgi:hypothetical protein